MVNGVHDMGGIHGLGPVEYEDDEPVFHSEWERRAFAITIAMGASGKWNIDKSRFMREMMPGPEYLTTSYYEHWIHGLEELLIENGFLTRAEIDSGQADPAQPKVTDARVLPADKVEYVLAKGGSSWREADVDPGFEVGDLVRVVNRHPLGHTRAPRYVRGHQGMVEIVHGIMVFPDASAMGEGEQPHYCYNVRFNAQELWGPDAPSGDYVYVDLWEDYLEPA